MNNTVLNSLLIFSLSAALLYFGKSIVLPLVFGFLLFVIISSWRNFFRNVSVFGKKIPPALQYITSAGAFIFLMIGVVGLLNNDVQNFIESLPLFETLLQERSGFVLEKTGFDIRNHIADLSSTLDIAGIAGQIGQMSSTLLGSLFTVMLYFAFILVEKKSFSKKLAIVSGDRFKTDTVLLGDILASIQQYISIKTIMSLLTAFFSYLVLTMLGLEFAFLFAFLIFFLNFIPSIGSLVATAIPTIFALVQFGTWLEPTIVLVLIGLVQIVVGNVIEPKYMGKKLNISPLLVIFSLFFWGALWGIPGMFLSVPLTVIIMIIFSRIPSTKKIAIWMSGDGVI